MSDLSGAAGPSAGASTRERGYYQSLNKHFQYTEKKDAASDGVFLAEKVCSPKNIQRVIDVWQLKDLSADVIAAESLAKGNDGEIFKAFLFRKPFAVKFYHRGITEQTVEFHEALQKFEASGKSTTHPGARNVLLVAKPVGWITMNDRVGLVFHYIIEPSPARRRNAHDQASVRSQLEFVHYLGFAHLDCTPRNILTGDGDSYLMDYDNVCRIGDCPLGPLPPESTQHIMRCNPARISDDEHLWQLLIVASFFGKDESKQLGPLNVDALAGSSREHEWQTDLYDCGADPQICVLGTFCPIIQMAYNKANADFRECHCCDCFAVPWEPFTRKQIRAYYGLPEPNPEYCCAFWCSICQDARELAARQGAMRNSGKGGKPPAPEPQRMTAVSLPPRVPANDQFSTGLFDCGLDPEGCLITFFCPFVSMGQNKAAVDGRDCLFSDCACPSTEYFTRKQLKAKYGIREDPAVGDNEWLVAPYILFCYPCVVCQDRREIFIRRYHDQITSKPVVQEF